MELTKGVIISRKLKKDIQYNGQTKNNIRKNNDLQNISQKNKDRTTRTQLKYGDELRFQEGLAFPAPLVISVVLLLNDTNII